MKDEVISHGSTCKEDVLAGSLYCYSICPYYNGTRASENTMPNIVCSESKVRIRV